MSVRVEMVTLIEIVGCNDLACVNNSYFSEGCLTNDERILLFSGREIFLNGRSSTCPRSSLHTIEGFPPTLRPTARVEDEATRNFLLKISALTSTCRAKPVEIERY